MVRFVFALLAMGALLGVDSVCAQPRACASGVQRHVVVDQDIQPATVRSDLDLKTLAAMAAKAGLSMTRPPEGFYVGTFFHTLAVKPAQVPQDCAADIDIHVTLHLTSRVIEVASEMQGRPCRYAADVAHYQKHAAADAAVIDRTARLIRADLASAPLAPGDLGAWVTSIIQRDTLSLNQDRRAAQNAVNTPDEYNSIDGACAI